MINEISMDDDSVTCPDCVRIICGQLRLKIERLTSRIDLKNIEKAEITR